MSFITCVWDKLPAWLQINFQAAQVMLGLTPTVLAVVAPSIGEISMLSSVRPGLSLLLSPGSPALFSLRPLEQDNPLSILKDRSDVARRQSLFRQQEVIRSGRREAIICAVQ
jgi:hypothetical protein